MCPGRGRYQLLDRPLRLGLVMRTRHGGRTRYVAGRPGTSPSTHAGTASRHPMALRRWSPSRGSGPRVAASHGRASGAPGPDSWPGTWDHTVAVHSFMAAMSRQARRDRKRAPTSRRSRHTGPGRTYRTAYGGAYGALNPDAYGRHRRLRRGVRHFFLELERRAGGERSGSWRSSGPTSATTPADSRWRRSGHGPRCSSLLRDEIAETGFLRMERRGDRNATGWVRCCPSSRPRRVSWRSAARCLRSGAASRAGREPRPGRWNEGVRDSPEARCRT